MMLNVASRSITLLLAVGASSGAAGSNLRRRRTTLSSREAAPQQQQQRQQHLRSRSVYAVAEPSMSMDKPIYSEGEPITVTFSVGAPSDEAPSPAVDRDYPKWSVGLFMRDADPQGGAMDPIASIGVCAALGPRCDPDDVGHERSYSNVVATFDYERSLNQMKGHWPLKIGDYGTGFDAYVLDGRGAAAIGPLSFEIREGDGEEDGAAQAGAEIISVNGLKMSDFEASDAVDAEEESVAESVAAIDTAESKLTTDKEEYESDESVVIGFDVPSSIADGEGYKIGIFMRHADPQEGSLPPIVSLPLCSEEGKCRSIAFGGMTAGSVTFSKETMDYMSGTDASWPMDLYQSGTGYDAYVLDGTGSAVVGPIMFNIRMDDD